MKLDWTPDLSAGSGPRYRAIADAIARDIDEGRLKPGDRLPPQRELAWALGVTVGTVSRAYQEAERRGLTAGEVGRGTYIRDVAPATFRDNTYATTPAAERTGEIDLRMNTPVVPEGGRALAATLADLTADADFAVLGSYGPQAGAPAHRAAGAAWIERVGLGISPDQVLVTAGVQHALLVTAIALMRPGDVMATEALAYPGLSYVASSLNLSVKPISLDQYGLVPDAFEAACRNELVKVLYTVPTLHNPTGAIQPEGRRREIAEIARRHDVLIVEDDIYGMLPSQRPLPIAAFAPERTIYATSVSKSMMPGLRVGFIGAPPDLIDRLERAIAASIWMVPPMNAEVVARWVSEGTADRLSDWHREEAKRRMAIARQVLGNLEYVAHPESYHLWLPVPEPIRAANFVATLARRGVRVHSAEMFAVGRGHVPHAVRVCMAPEPDSERLRYALGEMAALLREPQSSELAVI